MFGVSFGEFVLLALLAMVVIGPRELPRMARTIGKTLSKLRKAATDLREQSGIDEILQNEGIQKDVDDLRKLATGRILELDLEDEEPLRFPAPPRFREYPTVGVDAYGALPDDAAPYTPEKQAAAIDEAVTRGAGRPRVELDAHD